MFAAMSSPLPNPPPPPLVELFPGIQRRGKKIPGRGKTDSGASRFPDVVILGDFGLVETLLPGDPHRLDCVTV